MSNVLNQQNLQQEEVMQPDGRTAIPVLDVFGLYREGWQQEIVPAAFAHP